MDGTRTRTSRGKTLSSSGTAPLKPKPALSGPPTASGKRVPILISRVPHSNFGGCPILNFAFFAKFRVGMLEHGQVRDGRVLTARLSQTKVQPTPLNVSKGLNERAKSVS